MGEDHTERNLEQIENILAERDRLKVVNAKLLEACKATMSFVRTGETVGNVVDQLEAAIAAAEGE